MWKIPRYKFRESRLQDALIYHGYLHRVRVPAVYAQGKDLPMPVRELQEGGVIRVSLPHPAQNWSIVDTVGARRAWRVENGLLEISAELPQGMGVHFLPPLGGN